MSKFLDLGERRLRQAIDGVRNRQIPAAPRLAVEFPSDLFPSDLMVIERNDRDSPDRPDCLAQAVHNIVQRPVDESAIERVRLAARQPAGVEVTPPARPFSGMQRAIHRQGGRSRLGQIAKGLAMAAFIGFVVWQLAGPLAVDSPAYAQIRAATRKVDTIHVVVESAGPDGALGKAGELWYSRGVGFACVSSECTRIDDGKCSFEYVKGSAFGSRSPSQGPDWMLDQILDVKGELEDRCQRHAAGDKQIDNVACRCYQVMPPQVPAEAAVANHRADERVFVYVSDGLLVRRMETHEMADGKWLVRSARSWEYDVAAPRGTFQPSFGADVKIVDTSEVFGRLVDLHSAVHVTECDGLIYAVHRAEQLEDGSVAIMASVRATAERLEKSPPQRRVMQPGVYFVDGPTHGDRSPLGHGFFDIQLAQADHEGINVKWWVIVPRGRPASSLEAEPGKIMLDFDVSANGKFGTQPKQFVKWREAIAVSRTEPRKTLEAIAATVYAELVQIRAVKFQWFDLGVRDVKGSANGSRGTVEDTKVDQFVTAVAAHIKYWEQFDIDFQIKEALGMGPDFNPLTLKGSLIPAAYLGYYASVDDETLKRFAEVRPDIRKISLRHTKITNAGLAHLKSLEQLEDLDLAETAVDDAGLAHLQEIKSLRRLNVTGTRVTDAGLEKLRAAIPSQEINDGK